MAGFYGFQQLSEHWNVLRRDKIPAHLVQVIIGNIYNIDEINLFAVNKSVNKTFINPPSPRNIKSIGLSILILLMFKSLSPSNNFQNMIFSNKVLSISGPSAWNKFCLE